MKKLFLIVTGIIFGAAGGMGLLFFGGTLLAGDHPLLRTFGIQKPQVLGFAPYWLLDKATDEYGKYLTTFTYFGLVLDGDGAVVKLVNTQEEEPGWTNARSDRLSVRLDEAKTKGTKTSLLVHLADEKVIEQLLKDPVAHAQNLVGDVAPLMKEKGFDDLNIDIESFKEASPSTQAQFTTFVTEVKEKLAKEHPATLTVEVTPISLVKPNMIDAQAIGEIADYIVLMTYDYHYLGSFVAGPVAPIGGAGDMWEFDVETAVKEAVNVIPKEKLLLGIPLYGYEWETIRQVQGAATIPGGASTASHRRIEELLADCPDCKRGVGDVSGQPYIIYADGEYAHQIFYEDEVSLQKKIDLAGKYKLGGVALWALGYEGESLLKPLAAYKQSFRFSPSLLPRDWLPRR